MKGSKRRKFHVSTRQIRPLAIIVQSKYALICTGPVASP